MKKLLVTVIVLGVALCAAPSASAHASRTGSNPAFASRIGKLPTQVWIEFDGNLIDFGSKQSNFLIVKDPNGREIQQGRPVVGGARITVKVKNSRLAGRYEASWRVVSEDGHPVLGSIFFYLK